MIFNMAGSGGTSLNFTVVGGTSQPSSPKENTIWVNTSTTITSWVFSAEQPSSPTSGMVWIQTGDSSDATFNALKKNILQVYPLSAKQYVYYSWVDKEAIVYQNSTWVELSSNFYLYRKGNEYTDLTGGWTSVGKKAESDANASSLAPTITRADTYIRASITTSSRSGIFYMLNPINITGYSTLVVKGTFANSSDYDNMSLRLWSKIGTYYESNVVAELVFESGTTYDARFDISSFSNNSYYIGFVINTYGGGTNSYVEITECYLEE